MYKLLFVLCCLLPARNVSAQTGASRISDYLSVKKRNGITVDNYYPGMYINFVNTNGRQFEGPIDRIEHDSVFIKFFQIIKQPTIWGTYISDTVRTDILPFHYREIKNIVTYRFAKKRHYLQTLGTLAQIAGGGYFILNTVNTLREKENPFAGKNAANLAIAAGTFGAGWFMKRKYRSLNKINRKTQIVYVNMQ